MSHLLDVEEGGGVCGAPEVTRRGVPPTRQGGRGGVCMATSSQDLLGGSRAQNRLGCSQLRGASGHSGDALVGGALSWSLTHRASPPSRVSGVSLPPVTKGIVLTVTATPSPQRSSLETWHPAGGWSCGGVCPPPPKCQCPEGEPGSARTSWLVQTA